MARARATELFPLEGGGGYLPRAGQPALLLLLATCYLVVWLLGRVLNTIKKKKGVSL